MAANIKTALEQLTSEPTALHLQYYPPFFFVSITLAMGKVRVSQDKVPSVKDGSSRAKKITFDVDADPSDRIADGVVDDAKTAKAKAKGKDKEKQTNGKETVTKTTGKAAAARRTKWERSGDDEAPEEVRADTEEVRKLREWHEQLVLGKDAKKKKRGSSSIRSSSSSDSKTKTGELTVGSGSKYDREIDPSVLEEVDEEGEEEEEEEEEGEEEGEQEVYGRIDKHSRKSRRIDNVLVTVLDEQRLADPFSTFKPHKEAERFLGETLQRVEGRVRYARFAAGKSGGPAIKFALV